MMAFHSSNKGSKCVWRWRWRWRAVSWRWAVARRLLRRGGGGQYLPGLTRLPVPATVDTAPVTVSTLRTQSFPLSATYTHCPSGLTATP